MRTIRRAMKPLCVIALAATIAACNPVEGTFDEAWVRYQIEIPANADFTTSEPGPTTFCFTTAFEFIANKRLENQVPVEIPRVVPTNPGTLQQDGTCLLSGIPHGVVPPGEYRLVATNYTWTATCTVTLIAQATSGQFHNVRFVMGEPGCTEEVLPLPDAD